MSTSKTWNNAPFTLPDNNDPRGTWGVTTSNFLKALADNALAKYGGSFQLTGADIDFGTSFGLKVQYLKSQGVNLSLTGILRLANNEGVGFRNAANNADKIFKLDASDKWAFGASALSEAELGYASGVTSAIQTQLNAKVGTSDTIALNRGGTGQTTKAAAYDALSPNTTKGDIEAHNGTNNVRLPVGSNGQVLSADSAEATGLKWASPLTNPMTTSGDIIYGGGSGAATRLAANSTATKKWLRSLSSGTPTWEEVDSVKGHTSGVAIASGYLGEVYRASNTSSALTTAVSISVLNIVLPTAGVWAIYASAEFAGSATSCTQTRASVNTSAAANYTNSATSSFIAGYDSWNPNASINLSRPLPVLYVNASASQTVYLYGAAVFTGGNMSIIGYATAIRVA